MIYAHRFPPLSSRVLPVVQFNCVYRSLTNTLIFRLKHINMIIERYKKRLVDVERKIYVLKSELKFRIRVRSPVSNKFQIKRASYLHKQH